MFKKNILHFKSIVFLLFCGAIFSIWIFLPITANAQQLTVEQKRAQLESEQADLEKQIADLTVALAAQQKNSGSLKSDIDILTTKIKAAKLEIQKRTITINSSPIEHFNYRNVATSRLNLILSQTLFLT